LEGKLKREKREFRVSLKNSKKEKKREEHFPFLQALFFKERKDVSCSGYPGRGGENSRVQNRHGRVKRSGALSRLRSPSFSARL
jgi:hypothetical protein